VRHRRGRAHTSAGNPALDLFLDSVQCRIDLLQRGFAIGDGYVSEIDIDGKPRHVTQEQVDPRSAFEREDGFRGNERHSLDQQGHLLSIGFILRHR
jgi:hypothetical protein